MIRHLGFKNFAESYGGDLKKFLDSTSFELNKKWQSPYGDGTTTWGDLISHQAQQLDRAIAFTRQVFPDRTAFKKWTVEGYEQRFNRAIFDVMAHYFSDQTTREAATPHLEIIRRAFEILCDSNTQFRRSIETTTKTPFATYSRLALWGQTLASKIDTPLLAVERMIALLARIKSSSQ